MALVGHPYQDYSLAPGSKYKNYSVFVVRKPIKGRAGSVYPWFDEPGKATQIVLPSPRIFLQTDHLKGSYTDKYTYTTAGVIVKNHFKIE